MGLFDQMMGGVLNTVLSQAASSGGLGGLLNSAMSGPLAQAVPGLLDKALANTSFGSLDGLLGQLQQAGLGEQVASWLSSGPNAPVSAEQITAALGSTGIGQLAAAAGLSPDTLPNLLAEYLPQVIDRLSPDGVLHPPGA